MKKQAEYKERLKSGTEKINLTQLMQGFCVSGCTNQGWYKYRY